MSVWAHRQAVLTALGYPTYRDYLLSERWSVIRGTVLARDGHKCPCGRVATQVHHRRYAEADLLGETLDHMVAICRPCHKFGSKAGKRTTTPAEADMRIEALRATKGRAAKKKLAKRLRAAWLAANKPKSKPARKRPDGTWDVSATAGRFRT